MDVIRRNKISDILLLFGVIWLSFSCSGERDQWDDAGIDANIPKDTAYKELDKEKEIFTWIEKGDSLARRTSGVSYFWGSPIDFSRTAYTKHNNCRAYYFGETDTLSIDVGFGTGYGGSGFGIRYKDKKFYTEAYRWTDVIFEGEVRPTHKVVYQNLILDKAVYAVGDSLFGKIEFKSIETDAKGKKLEHFGKGYFRTKVSKL